MVDFALDAERHEGLSPEESIYQACLVRFRPIMMTTMAAMIWRAAARHRHGHRQRTPQTARHCHRWWPDCFADAYALHHTGNLPGARSTASAQEEATFSCCRSSPDRLAADIRVSRLGRVTRSCFTDSRYRLALPFTLHIGGNTCLKSTSQTSYASTSHNLLCLCGSHGPGRVRSTRISRLSISWFQRTSEAKGGANALHDLQSLRLTGKMLVRQDQIELGYLQTKKQPDEVRAEGSLQGMTQIEAYDGKEGWRVSPFFGRKYSRAHVCR